jgi:hypothetical protein
MSWRMAYSGSNNLTLFFTDNGQHKRRFHPSRTLYEIP